MPRYARVNGRVIENSYPEIRRLFNSEYRNLPAEDLEALLERVNISPEGLEESLEFLGSVGRAFSNIGGSVGGALNTFGRAAGQVLPQVLPGVIQGATTGAALGPWGALGGAVLGGVTSALGSRGQRPGQPAQPQAGPQMPTPQMPMPQMPMPQMPAIPGGSPAAAQMLGLLGRPEILQALMTMTLGQAGQQNIPVGNTPIPVGAFTNLVGQLANQAAVEYNALAGNVGEEVPFYLRNFAGEVQGDIANPEYRAARLLEMLNENEPAPAHYYSTNRLRRQAYPEDWSEADEYDELEWAMLASEEET